MTASSMGQQQQYHSHQYRTGQYHSGSSNSISGETGTARTNSGMTRSLVEMSGGVSGLQQPHQNIPVSNSVQVNAQSTSISLNLLSLYKTSRIEQIKTDLIMFTATQQSKQLVEERHCWSTPRAAAIPAKYRRSQPWSKWTGSSPDITTEQWSLQHSIQG
jgi:hypothetical protein